MSALSGAPTKNDFLEKRVALLEKKIDEIEKKVPKLTRFILPQGNEISVLFHIARSVCRRAERDVVHYFKNFQPPASSFQLPIIKYLNRLSDFFFVLARFYNKKEIFAHR